MKYYLFLLPFFLFILLVACMIHYSVEQVLRMRIQNPKEREPLCKPQNPHNSNAKNITAVSSSPLLSSFTPFPPPTIF
jgi:hypothetical protein